MNRISEIKRKTKETNIVCKLNLDGTGEYNISTGIGFVNLLPIPILDGGHILMMVYEYFSQRKPSEGVSRFSMIFGNKGSSNGGGPSGGIPSFPLKRIIRAWVKL